MARLRPSAPPRSSPHAALFTPLRCLGTGGMGEVWLAQMGGPSGEQVALKRIRVDLRDHASIQRQFEHEARLCSQLCHPNVTALRQWGCDEQGLYLAFEYVDGPSASRLIAAYGERDGYVPLPVCLSIGLDVACALEYAHGLKTASGERGVIHRDVSPDNVLLSRNGIAKLGDFGIARLIGATLHTKTGSIKGKLGFLAPELLDGATADVASDVFAFGVTLYRLLCGVAPFYGRTEGEVVRALLSTTPQAADTLRPEIPPAMSVLVGRCLSRDRRQRPAEMREIIEVLEQAITERSLDAPRRAVARAIAERFPEEASSPTSDGESGTKTVRVAPIAGPERSRARWGAWIGGIGFLLSVGLVWTALPFSPHEPVPVPVATPGAPAPAARTESDPASPPSPRAAEAPLVAGEPPAEAAPPAAPWKRARSPRPTKARLLVKVSPWGHVFVDGRLVGTSPLLPLALEPGTHLLLVANPKLNAEKSQTIDLRAGEEKTVRVVLDGP